MVSLYELLKPPPHEENVARFERALEKLARQHAFPLTARDRTFLDVEWHRLHRLDEIDDVADWAKRTEHRDLLRLARAAGDRADQASAQFAQVEVWLTASDRELINALIPKITSTVQSCGGTPGQHFLEYQTLEEGEGMQGYWFSTSIHSFE